MSDVLFLWAAQETWGGHLDKLVMMYIAKRTNGSVAYGVTEDRIMAWTGMTRGQVRATLARLEQRGHLVLVHGYGGPGWRLGHLHRNDPIILNMRDDA